MRRGDPYFTINDGTRCDLRRVTSSHEDSKSPIHWRGFQNYRSRQSLPAIAEMICRSRMSTMYRAARRSNESTRVGARTLLA